MYRGKFKERFESLRKEQNLSTNKIARYLGIGVASVQKYCYGENTPTFDNLCKIADLFGVSIDYLVGRSELDNDLINESRLPLGKFPQRFSEITHSKGISMIKIACALEMGTATLYKYASGEANPSYDKLLQLADLFGVSIDYLVGRTDEPGINKNVCDQWSQRKKTPWIKQKHHA